MCDTRAAAKRAVVEILRKTALEHLFYPYVDRKGVVPLEPEEKRACGNLRADTLDRQKNLFRVRVVLRRADGFKKAVGDGFLGVGAAAVNPGKLVLVVV